MLLSRARVTEHLVLARFPKCNAAGAVLPRTCRRTALNRTNVFFKTPCFSQLVFQNALLFAACFSKRLAFRSLFLHFSIPCLSFNCNARTPILKTSRLCVECVGFLPALCKLRCARSVCCHNFCLRAAACALKLANLLNRKPRQAKI